MSLFKELNPNIKNPVKTLVDTVTNLDGSLPNLYTLFVDTKQVGELRFQNGPLKENKADGCQIEDILSILIDRMKYFQCGNFACRENEVTLKYLELAMQQLNLRTANREARNVEGTQQL